MLIAPEERHVINRGRESTVSRLKLIPFWHVFLLEKSCQKPFETQSYIKQTSADVQNLKQKKPPNKNA